MGEILSHAELEAILSSINPSVAPSPISPPISPQEVPDSTWKHHDFRRMEPLRGEAFKLVHILHAGFGRQSKVRLESLLKTRIAIRPTTVCQTISREFLATLSVDSMICELAQPNLEPDSCFVWPRPLLFSMFSRMLGGGNRGTVSDASQQPLTSIEQRLFSKLNDIFLAELADILNVRIIQSRNYDQISLVPESISQVPAIWFSFELDCGSETGVIHLGLSRTHFSPQSKPLGRTSLDGGDDLPRTLESLPTGIQKVTIELSADLVRLKMRAADIGNLQIGDILMTDLQPSEPISLRLGDQSLCLATVGTHAGQKALRLIQSPRQPLDR